MMKQKINHNGHCLHCGKESKTPFCNRQCYRDYIKGLPKKDYEKQQRDSLSDRVVKRTIYIGGKGTIKYNQITPEMITEKRARILARRARIAAIPPKTTKHCKMCGKEIINRHESYCSDECRKEKARQYHYEISKAKKGLKEHICNECGNTFIPEYGNKRRGYCSRQCMNRSINRNAHHIRRIRLKNGFIESVYKARIFKRDNGMCQICGKKVSIKQKAPHPYSASLDHIIPLAKGGTHEPKNVRLVHFICNSIKSDGVSNGGDQLLLFG
jgi:endogenous inhibitor of DNA gyrase (YacG/DUF329 family)